MRRRTIIVRDETLRDGSQQVGIDLSNKDRLELSYLIAQVLNSPQSVPNNQIDLGMPEVSKSLFTSVREISEALSALKGIDFFVTGRSTKASIDIMCDALSKVSAGRKVVAPFIGISKLHRRKLGMSEKDVLKRIIDVVSYSKKYIKRIHFPLEGGYYAYLKERDFVYKIFSVLSDLGVEAVPFCDTTGVALPFIKKGYISYGQAVRDLRKRFPRISIPIHCHDDLSLAIANSIDGLLNGAAIADGTFFGIGERAGNTSLQTLLTVLEIKGNQLGLKVNANLDNLYRTSRHIGRKLGIRVADNTPIIGKNVFSHASGIHQDGILKDKRIYRPYIAKRVGVPGYKIVLGKLSGRKGIDYILKNKYKIKLSDYQLLKVAREFKELSKLGKSPEKRLLKIVYRVLKLK